MLFRNSVVVIKPKQTAHSRCANHEVSAVRNLVCKHLCGYCYIFTVGVSNICRVAGITA